MRVPRLPEPRSRCLRRPWGPHFDYPGRDAADHREIRYIPDHNGVRADDHVIADSYASQDLGAGAEIDTVADGWRAKRVSAATVTERDTMTDQTVIAHDRVSMDDDTAVVLYRQPPADFRRGADDDAAENLRELVEDYVDNRPGRPHDFVADGETGVAEAIHQQGPEADSQQAFALRLEIFERPFEGVHRRFRRGVGPTAYAKGDGRSAHESYAILPTTDYRLAAGR